MDVLVNVILIIRFPDTNPLSQSSGLSSVDVTVQTSPGMFPSNSELLSVAFVEVSDLYSSLLWPFHLDLFPSLSLSTNF